MLKGNEKEPFALLGQPEQLFLSQVIRSVVTSRGVPAFPPDLDWSKLNSLILTHRLGPIFSWAMNGDSMSAPLNPQCQQQYRKTWMMNLLINKVAVKFFNLIESAGLEAVGLRGLNLANFIYPDLALRPMSDLDILIRPEDKERLVEILAAQNHHPIKTLRSQMVYQIEGVTIEVHWSFLTAKRYRMEFDPSELLAAAETRFLPQGPVKILAQEQQVIDLIFHGYIHHELNSFLQLIDLAFFLISPDLNWKYLFAWCRKHHLSRMFIFSLSLVNCWLNLGRESLWRDFCPNWPGLDSAINSHLQRLFGTASFSDQWYRAKILLYVAERPGVKFRQILRLFSTGNLWFPGRRKT